jgi:mannose-1-phosphate guanylyltransferase
MNLFPVVMAGGSGTRFWPLSRRARPKQFLPLASERPLIVETVNRLAGLATLKETFVVCGKAHAAPVRKLVKGLPAGNIIVEPAARNTAPAIGLATLHVARKDPHGVVAALPSDAFVKDAEGFRRDLEAAAALAMEGYIVTVGIKPSRPETGYGYIRRGEKLGAGYRVAAFVEKPDLPTARMYVSSPEYLWNGGIFVFRCDVMQLALARHMPDLWAGLSKLGKLIGKKGYASALEKIFPRLPATSIDYGVAEKAENIAVVPGDFGWSDVGSFAAIPDVRRADDAGNVVTGKNALVIDSEGCVVVSDKRLISVVGMKDTIVVDSGDALLILPKDKAQDVRKVVEALKQGKLEKFL